MCPAELAIRAERREAAPKALHPFQFQVDYGHPGNQPGRIMHECTPNCYESCKYRNTLNRKEKIPATEISQLPRSNVLPPTTTRRTRTNLTITSGASLTPNTLATVPPNPQLTPLFEGPTNADFPNHLPGPSRPSHTNLPSSAPGSSSNLSNSSTQRNYPSLPSSSSGIFTNVKFNSNAAPVLVEPPRPWDFHHSQTSLWSSI
ncbi:hypothetical protein Fcan01_22910 [Folsomia candida]|uniref:Uncharacterized protein n=1 Tax=Folsomia candida TaxID=158441 RepID=A0A226DEA0_FOLCA|nr:hypothetical protein Fcan01_22910 [Folsomia candida]